MTPEQLENTVLRALAAHDGLKTGAHCSHCVWIEEQIASQKARRDLVMEVAKAVAQYSVLGLLGWVWYFFKEHFQWRL